MVVAPAAVVPGRRMVGGGLVGGATAQAAALASIGDEGELQRRRLENARGRAQLEAAVRGHGFEPVGPALGNFVYVEVGDGRAIFDRLLRLGVIVRPLDGFGAPGAIRVSVGTEEENSVFAAAFGHVHSGVSS